MPYPQSQLPEDDVSVPWEITSDVRGRMTKLHHEVELVVSFYRYQAAGKLERRRLPRHPYPCVLDAWLVENKRPTGEKISVIGKNISLGGIDFFHCVPLVHRHVIVSLEQSSGHRVHLLTEVNWCRFIRDGWYDSGGKFLHVVHDPRRVPPAQLPAATPDP